MIVSRIRQEATVSKTKAQGRCRSINGLLAPQVALAGAGGRTDQEIKSGSGLNQTIGSEAEGNGTGDGACHRLKIGALWSSHGRKGETDNQNGQEEKGTGLSSRPPCSNRNLA